MRLNTLEMQLSGSHYFLLQEKHKRIHQVACDISGPIGWRASSSSQIQGRNAWKRCGQFNISQLVLWDALGKKTGRFQCPDTAVGTVQQTISLHRDTTVGIALRSVWPRPVHGPSCEVFCEFGIALIPTYFLSASRGFCVNQNELEATISVVEYFCIGVPVRGPSHLALRLVSC